MGGVFYFHIFFLYLYTMDYNSMGDCGRFSINKKRKQKNG